MSHPVFLIDLASVRPPTPPPPGQWPAIAKEHVKYLTQCIHRILAHSDVTSVTTHVFDSTVLTHAGIPSTKPLKQALEDLKRLPNQIASLDTTGVRHPTAQGVLAGLTDGAPEDKFSDFYTETKSAYDIYLFVRAPASRAALAAFLGSKEFSLSALEQNLGQSPFLPKKLRKLASHGDRLIWVNSTPRRCELPSDVDHKVEQAFSKWLLSYSPQFRFAGLHSFLLDRRIVPASAVVRSLWDNSDNRGVSLGKLIEVLSLQDSQLLRCFSACMNVLVDPDQASKTSKVSLVLSGLVRSYRTEELAKFGAFSTQARLITPAPSPSNDEVLSPFEEPTIDSRPPCSSIFAGMMVDLARQNMCLIADFFEVDEACGSFTRYQTLLHPITPLSAVLRKVSRTEPCVNYNSSCLPQNFQEWKSWGKFENLKDCDMTDSPFDVSARFFETYLPSLFSPAKRDSAGTEGAGAAKPSLKKTGMTQDDNMALSFEGDYDLLQDNGQEALSGLAKDIGVTPKALQDARGAGTKVPDRDLIMKQLQAQQDAGQEKELQVSPKPPSNSRIRTPQKSRPRKEKAISPKSGFKWESRSKVVAPSNNDIQKCIDIHVHDRKGDTSPDKSPDAICKRIEKTGERVVAVPKIVARSDSIIGARLSPTTPEDDGDECLLSDGRPESNSAPTKSQVIAADPDDLERNSGSRNCSPETAQTYDITEREQPARTVDEDENIVQSESPIPERKNQNVDVLKEQDLHPHKRQESLNLPSMKESTKENVDCESYHARRVRGVIEEFSACVKKLRNEDARAIEGVIWECVTHLSSLAEALSSHHDLQCDINRIINLNLKLPRAVAEAVQDVQNKGKNDDISPNSVLHAMWETIISAFEQAVWHLARSWKAGTKKMDKKRSRLHVHHVSSILTCTQLMAENATNSRWQPVSFRKVLSKLFSSAFVHFGRKNSGACIPEVVSLFEEFEQPLPLSLRETKNNDEMNSGNNKDQRKTYANTGGRPQSQPVLSDATLATRPGKHPIPDKLASKITKKRSRAAKMDHSTMVPDARNKAPKVLPDRPQFAKESEALRNAMYSQARLLLQSTKSGKSKKLRSKEAKRGIRKHEPDGSTLRDILASTVPAPVIDGLDFDGHKESVEETPPQTRNQNKNKFVEKPTIEVIKDSGTQSIAKVAEPSLPPGEKRGHEENLVSSENGKRGFDRVDSAPGSIDEVIPAKASPVDTSANRKEAAPDNQEGTGSTSPRRMVTRRQAKQVLSEKIEEKQVSVSASPASTRRLTRSQAKQTTQKRMRETSLGVKEPSPGSSGRKVRQRKEASSGPNVPNDSLNMEGCESSPTSSSPLTRSQAKALEEKTSLQLRNRSVNRPRRLATVRPVTRDVVADSEMNCPMDVPKTPDARPPTPAGDVQSPETPRPVRAKNMLTAETSVGLAASMQENSALRRIVNSSLEKRKEQFEKEDFIPETPMAPRPSQIIPPSGRNVRRVLKYDS